MATKDEKTTKEKTYKIRFESMMEDREFIVKGKVNRTLPDGKKVVDKVLKKPIRMKHGQTQKIDQATYDYLMEGGLLLTKEQKEERDKTRRKYGNMKRERFASDSAPPNMTDEEKKQIYIDLPYLEE